MKKTVFLSISFLTAYSYCSDDAKSIPLLTRSSGGASASTSDSSATSAVINIELDKLDRQEQSWNSETNFCYMFNDPKVREQRAVMMKKARETNPLAYNTMLNENTLITLKQMQDAGREGARLGTSRVRIFYCLAAVGFIMGLIYKFALPTPSYLK